METKNKLGVLVTLFLGIVVCLALLPTIAENIQDMTEKRDAIEEYSLATTTMWNSSENETINTSYVHIVTNYPTGWRIRQCPLTSFTFGNSTLNYTLTTDYTTNLTAGTFQLLNTSNVVQGTNKTNLTYDWCTTGYVTNSGGRGIARLILILAALGLLSYAVYLGVKEFL